MNSIEKEMIDLLVDLRENHCALGVKSEFEEEGASYSETGLLKEIANLAGLDLTIKIGGCKAIKEMYEAREIGAITIVAPMIETPYAAKSYLESIKLVFSEEERRRVAFFINIETITGYVNIDEILNLPESEILSGIVFGRGDMVKSIGLTKDDVNSDRILKIASALAKKTSASNKKLIIGGSVSTRSLSFFRKVPTSLNKIETRKVIFDAQKLLNSDNAEEAILKAINFELMWINNKRENLGIIRDIDAKRIITLENCCNKSQNLIHARG
jgi:hypothetical protein